MTTDQIHAITSVLVHSLSTQDIAAMTMDQLNALHTAAISEMSSAQLNAFFAATPIMLDLDGGGVNTVAASQGVNFDLIGAGQTHKVGWVGGNDGLLVMDRNHDGIINNGSELFGMGTILANGKHAADGYQAMLGEDTNLDGKLDANDTNWKELKVWVDANHDGKTDAGELKSLDEAGVASLDLHAAKSGAIDNGNLVGLVSSFTTTDGKQHQMADVWFAKDVQPQKSEHEAPPPKLGDLLADAHTQMPGHEHLDLSKAPPVHHMPDVHLAALDRKLQEEEEQRRNALGGGI
jgi:hypothetical protein